MAPSVVTVPGAGGLDLAVHHLGGDGPPVMLVHATGFHGRCWIPLARSLVPYFTVWALDQRGHGASGKDPDGRYDDWEAFAADLLAAVDAIGGTGWRAAGHSLGGGVSLLAEARRPGTFTAIACYEPVVFPPGSFDAARVPPGDRNPLAVLARKRRPAFPSRQAALENYRSKPPFSAFTAEALECYVEYGFVDQPDGTVTLACRREDEAAVFEGAIHSPTWSALPDVRSPVAILAGSDHTDPVGRVAADVARRLPRGGFRRVAGLDHFGPMTAPGLVGSLMAVALESGERMGDGKESPMPVTPPK
jgi:pimeloyl-ACP methyl ester carboxylesterase